MIAFRFPWYIMTGGILALVLAYIAPIHSPIGFALILAGTMLLLDGSLGDRVLPRLTPHASFPEDWREIEHNLYLRGLGLARLIGGALACIGLAVSSASMGGGDWQGWYMVATGTGWVTSWVVAALRAIRDALANDL